MAFVGEVSFSGGLCILVFSCVVVVSTTALSDVLIPPSAEDLRLLRLVEAVVEAAVAKAVLVRPANEEL